jgi:hypothetical protein
MIFIPMGRDAAAPTQTRHSRELARRVDQVVQDFRREYPDLSEDDVRAALDGMTPRSPSRRSEPRRLFAIAFGLAAALAAGVGTMFDVAENGGSGIDVLLVVAGTIAVFGLVAALLLTMRK